MPKLTKERLQEIADALQPKKPVISIRKLEEEAGLPQSTVNQILKGRLKLDADRIKKLEKIIKKYKL